MQIDLSTKLARKATVTLTETKRIVKPLSRKVQVSRVSVNSGHVPLRTVD